MSGQLSVFVAFCIVASIAYVGYLLVDRLILRLHIARRLGLAAGGAGRSRVELNLAQRSADIKGFFGRVFALLGAFLPLGEDDRRKIATALRRAGFRSANTTTVVLGAKAAALLGGLLVGLAAVPPMVTGALGWGAGLIAGFLLGVMLNLVPELVVARMAVLRSRRIHAGLPDAFDLLIVCLESGLTFERALQRTVADLRSFRPELATELRHASLEMSVHGRTREDALGRLASHLDSRDFRDFATTVAQSERHGTPLADSLRKLAGSVRVQVIAAMQAKVARLPVLLILPTMAFVLPGIIVIVGGPAFVNL
ncbi:MAG: type II secretion system F family protein, partial [Gammaproteobacteria bacterium]|nr:type II secretion system F family protein [Gammaproteobacteria bacterium]